MTVGDCAPTNFSQRCWGLGLGRTGTNSFCEALRILGYVNVKHNPLFEDLRSMDGGADSGVVLHYKYLDYKFPFSKFVLTIRDMSEWLRSVEFMLSQYPVHSRDEDVPIYRRMTLFETVAFEREKFAQSYIRHQADVRRYFAQRPGDLLELNIINGEGWEELCPFLGLQIPAMPFPYLNRRE